VEIYLVSVATDTMGICHPEALAETLDDGVFGLWQFELNICRDCWLTDELLEKENVCWCPYGGSGCQLKGQGLEYGKFNGRFMPNIILGSLASLVGL